LQAHFSAPSNVRRKLMSSTLSKELRNKLGVKSMPIRKGDQVKILRGKNAHVGIEGKVVEVYRKKWVIHIEGLNLEKKNGQRVPIGFDASKVAIVKLHMDKDRKALIEKKRAGKGETGKFSEEDIASNANTE
jgi:large subunit ribosomal protein L26e